MSELHSMIRDTDRFDWTKEKVFVSFISDLGHDFRFVALYDDAADIGFTLMSAETGNLAQFYVGGTTRDRDNDILWWVLYPTVETVRRLPALEKVWVKIFND
jgi:hypothetical protein